MLDYKAPPAVKFWQQWIEERVFERTAVEEAALRDEAKAPREDFFTHLFKHRDQYSDEELLEECALLVIAGADTTAIVMSAILFYVVRRPDDVQQRLEQEVRSAFGSAAEIVPGAKLHSCKYLRAVVLEGLRMAPPVAAELSREILAGGTTVEGDFFPAGVILGTCTYALGYNEKVFPEPFAFRPERWLGAGKDDGDGDDEADERALPAFSAGARGCAGKNLAWMEMMLLLAKLFYLFDVRKDPNSGLGGGSADGREGRRDPNHYQLYDTFVAARDGPMIQLKRRAQT